MGTWVKFLISFGMLRELAGFSLMRISMAGCTERTEQSNMSKCLEKLPASLNDFSTTNRIKQSLLALV